MDLISGFGLGFAGLLIGVLGIVVTIRIHYANEKKLEKLEADKETLETANRELEAIREQLKNELPVCQIHTVLMDGMTSAGKTTFASRFSNPTLTVEELKDVVATQREYIVSEYPICWQKPNDKTVLNMIRFYDVAGENPATVVNALYALTEEEKDPGNRVLKNQNVVLVLMWDLEKGYEENMRYLSEYRLIAVFGNVLARRTIKSIVVFFNKAEGSKLEEKEKEASKYFEEIQAVFRKHFESGYGDLVFRVGSALKGNGLHDCYGDILQRLNLSGQFKIKLTSSEI